ncbi:peptidase M24 [Eikenella sp. NML03-A-027]|uniref:aminopeptidase P family protein n=1 Tax=Eikenella sp. NML03-A-027 TaxID=1795828 RepID=UPI0007E05C00|nr:aminopeptidase P family protein [Eikenella sp. NML03-A-027]OAM31570.1 peptidase M24 [Eikenella sp. NML03-A-027]
MSNIHAQRLAALRQTMQEQKIDVWIVPSADPHISEYLPEHWCGRAWLSGFDGSVGTLAVSADFAELWVDSRYWEQAKRQLEGSGFVLQKLGQSYPTMVESLAERLPENSVVGIPADGLSLSLKHEMQADFAAKNIYLRLDTDLLNNFWHDRPGLPESPIFVHEARFSPESVPEKLARVRAAMKEFGADRHLVSSLDDIAWITNLRCNDVPFNPLFISYLLIDAERATLFVNPTKLTDACRKVLNEAKIDVAEYRSVVDAVGKLSGSLLVDPDRTAVYTLGKLPDSVRVIKDINPSTLFKACKSEAEIEHAKHAMVRDGVALCGFFAELEQKLAVGEIVTELDIDTMLIDHRSRQADYISLSFDTIAGFNENAALPHYAATPEHYSTITGQGILLIDSGAHYLDGTTDITRVIPIGSPTAEQKRDYTRVLKAHIALAEAVFPENLSGQVLDAICRAPLWKEQCDYGHGTGHGVGYFLNVHQGPQKIAYNTSGLKCNNMKENMITSNEPGLYRSGKWGIRIENLVVHRRVKQPKETEFGQYLCFEQLTLCPIDTQLIERSMLSDDEAAWLNDYHSLVREKLAPHTEGAAKAWLEKNTQPI